MKEPIISSSNGNFILCKREGIGINDTPYTQLEVVSVGDADKYVVEIRLNSIGIPDYNGKLIKYTYNECYISYGMRSVQNTFSDIKAFINVLNEALEFSYKINDYIEYKGNNY